MQSQIPRDRNKQSTVTYMSTMHIQIVDKQKQKQIKIKFSKQDCLLIRGSIYRGLSTKPHNAVMLRQSTKENPLKKTCFSFSVQYT